MHEFDRAKIKQYEISMPNKKQATSGIDILPLHAALSIDELWKAGIALIRQKLCVHNLLLALPCVGTRPFQLKTSFQVRNVDGYWARLAAVAPLDGIVAEGSAKVTARLSDDIPADIIPKLPFYKEFMQPEGWRFAAAMFFWEGEVFIGHLGLNRTQVMGDFTDTEIQLLRKLQPHFQIAVQRILRLDRERSIHEALQASLHDYPTPTVLIDWDGNVLLSNPAAARATTLWTNGQSGLNSLKPVFELPSELREFILDHRCLIEAEMHKDLPLRTPAPLQFPHPEDQTQWASVHTAFDRNRGSTRPVFILHFHRKISLELALDDAQQILTGLSPIERNVALALAPGATNQAIANQIGISIHTVRAHLRTIFKKTGIKTRGQLAACARLLASQGTELS